MTISNNTLTSNRYEGIYLFGGPTTISGNTFNGPGNIGVQYGTVTDNGTTTAPAP